MDKRLQTLQEKYFLPENLKKKFIKIPCPNCGGNNKAVESYPKVDCSLCGGVGFIIEEEKCQVNH